MRRVQGLKSRSRSSFSRKKVVQHHRRRKITRRRCEWAVYLLIVELVPHDREETVQVYPEIKRRSYPYDPYLRGSELFAYHMDDPVHPPPPPVIFGLSGKFQADDRNCFAPGEASRSTSKEGSLCLNLHFPPPERMIHTTLTRTGGGWGTNDGRKDIPCCVRTTSLLHHGRW